MDQCQRHFATEQDYEQYVEAQQAMGEEVVPAMTSCCSLRLRSRGSSFWMTHPKELMRPMCSMHPLVKS